MNDVLQSIYGQYPAMSGYDFNVIDSRGKESKHGGQLEFYPPDELYNPAPGRPTVEVFNPQLQGPMLERAIFGDMLHYLPMVDDKFRNYREQFRSTITPEQSVIDRMAYQRGNESRPYDKWFEMSRLDAYIRGFLAPDAEDDWRSAYTDEQRAILKDMDTYLRSPRAQ